MRLPCTRQPARNRTCAFVGLAAVTLALLVGCGKESSSAQCRDGYVKIYKRAVKLLADGSPSDPSVDDKMMQALSGGLPKGCKADPAGANKILYQVEHQFDSQLAALEGKWGRNTINGFRDPLTAGHGPPIDESSTPSPGTDGTPGPTQSPPISQPPRHP